MVDTSTKTVTVTHEETVRIVACAVSEGENVLVIILDRRWEDLSDEMKDELLQKTAPVIAAQQPELTEGRSFSFMHEVTFTMPTA